MAPYTESPISDELQKEFDLYYANGLNNLNLTPEQDAGTIVNAVGDFIDQWQKAYHVPLGRLPKPNTIDIALCLGIVWGNQVCRTFGWHWADLSNNGQTYFGIVSPDAKFVVLPTYSIRALLDEPGHDNATILFFNMIRAENLPPAAPGDYHAIDIGA